MQPQQGYLRKLTRLGLGLIAVAALTLSASASAVVDAGKATAAPKYRVLIVTSGIKKDGGLNEAGINAIKAIGKDTGAGGKFSIFVASNAEQINDQFTETNLAQVPRGHLPRTAASSPAQRRAEGRVRELLPQRRRLPRDRLRDRDRARLAVLHRHPRGAGVRQDGRPVGDDQGRRPRSRRVEEPARVLEPDRRLVQLHGERPRRLARPRHGRRGSVRPAAAGPGSRRDRRRHDGLRPSGRLVQGLQGRPLLLHGARKHRGELRRGRLQEPARGRDRLDGRRGRQRSTATAARPCSRTTSRPRSASRT